MNRTTTLALVTGYAFLAMMIVAALVYIRPVAAEDDCNFNTYAVERLPLIGLVCIGE
jgi:hypothetical protein